MDVGAAARTVFAPPVCGNEVFLCFFQWNLSKWDVRNLGIWVHVFLPVLSKSFEGLKRLKHGWIQPAKFFSFRCKSVWLNQGTVGKKSCVTGQLAWIIQRFPSGDNVPTSSHTHTHTRTHTSCSQVAMKPHANANPHTNTLVHKHGKWTCWLFESLQRPRNQQWRADLYRLASRVWRAVIFGAVFLHN